MKKLAIIGKPNVGKSSLFNRLLKMRDAITSEQAGTTRDTKRRVAQIEDREVELLDTGGLDDGNDLFDKIRHKSIETAHEADIILYMVDGRGLSEDDDRKLFYELQKMGKSVALVINKMDNDKLEENKWQFYQFGTDDIFPISVSHNRKVNALLKWIYVQLDEGQSEHIRPIDDDENIKISIIGRVNVGKSSLLNALLGEERSIVSSTAGTTIDPIDEVTTYNDRKITFVDTAGIRRRGKIQGIEKYALMRTEEMLEKADIAILVLDASAPFTDLDEKIAGLIDKNQLGCLIVLNKWDIKYDEFKKVETALRDRFKFLHYAPIMTISALTNRHIHKIFDYILRIFDNFTMRIPTSKLNETIEMAIRKHHLPSPNGRMVRIYYATQYDVRPPKIALVMNRPKDLHFSYRRYLTNTLRETFDFEGTPVLFKAKAKKQSTENDLEQK